MKLFIPLIIAIFLSSCAGYGQVTPMSSLSIDEMRAVNDITLYEDDNGLKYSSLGKVKGLSCKGSALSGSTSREAAETQLKIKAIRMGANAVLYPTCGNDASVDWGNNCWESWVCVGEAVIVE